MIFDIKKVYKVLGTMILIRKTDYMVPKKIVVESSNIGTAQIALKIGKDFQKDFLDKLGFFKKYESFETEQLLANPNNWGYIKQQELINIVFQ